MADNIPYYGIKYKVVEYDKDKFVLIPDSLVKGYSDMIVFRSQGEAYPIPVNDDDYRNPYIVMNVRALDELEMIYEMDGDEKFYEDNKDTITFVDLSGGKGNRTSSEINLGVLKKQGKVATYVMDEAIPSALLNEKALNELLEVKDQKELKLLIERYKKDLNSFSNFSKKGVSKVTFVDGKPRSIETDRRTMIAYDKVKIEEAKIASRKDVSYQGFRKYMLERIFSHDEEIERVVLALYMNYTAEKGDSMKSILLVGPTGTGKTETVECAANYLGLPYVSVNTANLVPQGIRGVCMEEAFCSLLERANKDVALAQRGIFFLDEFDKLNDLKLDIKEPVRHILLTYMQGGVFPVATEHYHFTFETAMLNKMYAGVFERIQNEKSTMGFGSQIGKKIPLGTSEEIRQKILDEGYYTEEELSRIRVILGYEELTREAKKDILLHSKSNELANRINRYKRQFNVSLVPEDSFIDALLDLLEHPKSGKKKTGMRNVNNEIEELLTYAERTICDEESSKPKTLVLTRDTVEDPRKFDLY